MVIVSDITFYGNAFNMSREAQIGECFCHSATLSSFETSLHNLNPILEQLQKRLYKIVTKITITHFHGTGFHSTIHCIQ